MPAKQKILIVDDRKENLLALRGVLAELDAEVIEAGNGNDALAATLQHDFALALLDVQMPEMDGYELAALLHGAPRTHHLPIVFLTAAYGEKEQVFKGYAAGAVDYLIKPYDPQVLLSKVHVFLELHRATSALAEKVAALAASEERYRSLVTTIPDIVYRIDQEGRFSFLNDAVGSLGYTPEELIGKHFSTIMLPPDVEAASRDSVLPRHCGSETGVEGVRRTAGLEVRLLSKQGRGLAADLTWQVGEVSSSGLFNATYGKQQAEFLGTVGVIRNITERKHEARLLQQAKSEAEKANNAKSSFLAAASHDLRQPLAALTLYVNLLEERMAASEQALVASMNDCLANLSELLKDLLDLSKLEAAAITPCLSDFPIAELFNTLESVHAPEAEGKGLRLRYVPSGLTVRTDLVLLRRCLGNLVENAIRYTDRGSVLIACRRRQGKAWIEVRDSGIGIAADKTTEIFEEFRQLNDTPRNKGSGLGLAIVARTAALLGLEISVRSRPGQGSVFAIKLPLGQAAADTPAPAPHPHTFRALRIALVDDNPLVCQALVAGLQQLGHQVIAATSTEDLLAKLGTLPPDIVLSDYRLKQGETGFDVITAVRARAGAELPAILITGDTDPKLLRNMTRGGFVVLHKPLGLDDLQASLNNLTSLAR